MTREEYLQHAVEEINEVVFKGDLDLDTKQYQISCGRVKGNRGSETFFPYEGEAVDFDDFFPLTIIIDHTIKDEMEILSTLTFECLHAFFNEPKVCKRFKGLAAKYYFDKPYGQPHPSDYLMELIHTVHKNLKRNFGEWPGKAIVIKPKEKKEKKKNVFTAFCPDCGYEVKISKKMLDKYQGTLPSCPCGSKMGLDLEDENKEEMDGE